MKNKIIYVVILLLGVSSLVLAWKSKTIPMDLICVALGVTAMKLKLNLAKKGHKSKIATIGSYAGAAGNAIAILDLIATIILM